MSTNISFKFSKTSRAQLTATKNSGSPFQSRQKEESEEILEEGSSILVSGFGRKGAEDVTPSLDAKTEKKELIIPALENTIKVFRPANEGGDEEAKRALLEDAKRYNEDGTVDVIDSTSTIALDLNSTEKLDIADILAEEADYESVPVDIFGKALLRGMGWQEGQAIGRSGKKAAVPVVTAPRPKGLGLGAESKQRAVTYSGKNEGTSKELTLKIGAYVKRTDAKGAKDRYGKVISWDEDNACVVVQTAIEKSTTRLSHHVVRVVSREEYEKMAKCINQESYEKYKEEEEKTKAKKRKEPDPEVEIIEVKEKPDQRSIKEKQDKDANKDRVDRRIKSHGSSSSKRSSTGRWLRPDIRVRIIDEKYRRGKYYKTKAVIVDVKAADVCSCIAEDGRTLLDDLSEDMLETVVPRKQGASVMIVRGSGLGQIGTILERDSRDSVAVVKLPDAVRTLSFDDICEYAGDGGEF